MEGTRPSGRLVTLAGIHLSIGETLILENVDLALESGAIVSLIGPNGSGKTTLARVLLGLARPDRGSVRRRPGLRIGYVPQKVTIDDILPITVGRFLTLTRRFPRETLLRTLEEVGAAPVLDRPVQAVSGGEFQRVLLARALLCRPDLLVLDEPAQGVDVTGQQDLYALIKRQRDRFGCGVLLVSHDLHVVMASTDEVVCLNRHICCTGRPEVISGDPVFQRLFGQQAAVYRHKHDHGHGPDGRIEPVGKGPPAGPAPIDATGTDG